MPPAPFEYLVPLLALAGCKGGLDAVQQYCISIGNTYNTIHHYGSLLCCICLGCTHDVSKLCCIRLCSNHVAWNPTLLGGVQPTCKAAHMTVLDSNNAALSCGLVCELSEVNLYCEGAMIT